MMGWNGGQGMGWGAGLLMLLGSVVLIGATVAIVLALLRTPGRGPEPGPGRRPADPATDPAIDPATDPGARTAREVLDGRFARGEIDEGTYRAHRAALADGPGDPGEEDTAAAGRGQAV